MFHIIGGDGKEYGPITAAHIREWIQDGRVNLQTKAKLDRENVWKTLGDFAEFARQAAPAPTLPSAPPLLAARPDSAAPTRPAGRAAPASTRWLRLPAYREELRAAGIGRDEDSIRAATHSLIAAMQPRAASTFDAFLDLVGRPARRIVLPSGHTTG